MPYYGLYIPVKGGGATASGAAATTNSSALGAVASSNGGGVAGLTKDNETAESPFVFRKKSEALALLKKHKDARLKEFGEEEDAIKYAETGFEIVQTKYNDIKTSTAAVEKAAFRAPTKQELVEFRKKIETGEYERVKQMIWDNPRYLVSSGDTPTTLKEGYRYNAMHICSIFKRPQIAELILKTVSDPNFVDLLTGKKNDQKMCIELCANLLDFYLNMPEKGRSETPLHLASKLGCLEMVELLTSYAECKMTPNSEGRLPREIICTRFQSPNYNKIKRLFGERYYVPVLRCNDSSLPAQIGEPFAANEPPNFNCDPLSPEVEIKALAGPMTKDHARKFFRRWKTPPRLGSNASSPIANYPFISPMKSQRRPSQNTSFNNSPTAMLQRRTLFQSTPQRKDSKSMVIDIFPDSLDDDHQNGNGIDKENQHESLNKPEANNNHHLEMTEKIKVGLCPRTPLFKIKKEAFFSYREQNSASPIVGSLELENNAADVLNCSDVYDSPGFKERHLKNTDTEKGIECIGRNLAMQQNVEWREYWDFLEEFIDIASEQGLKKLENFLGQRQREQDIQLNKKTRHNSEMLEEVCSALEKFGFGRSSTTTDAMKSTPTKNQFIENGSRNPNNSAVLGSNTSSMAYTYVEKSLQVHARRMTKTILHNIDNVVSINDSLLLELRRVKSLICSFKEDDSFLNVNFEKVHSRVGSLVSIFLKNSQEITVAMKAKILSILQNLLETPGERREHIECVLSRILDLLENPVEQILPENLKTEVTCTKIWSQEKDCDCQWDGNLSRKSSRRNRIEARYRNHQRMKQQEKTIKQQNIDNVSKVAVEYRDANTTNDSAGDIEEEEEDVFWSDFGDSNSEEDEVWLTPPESLSRLSLNKEVDDDGYKIFIYGNEPTKRDLDVLNAIFHVDINKNEYPTVFSWKTAIMRYSNDEMDFFPSPRIVKKSQNVINKNDNKPRQLTRANSASIISNASPRQQQTQPLIRESILQQLPSVKRLFMSPERPKSMTAIPSFTTLEVKENNETAINTIPPPPLPVPATNNVASGLKMIQRPLTPLNKLRGLFSSYRERTDDSPLPSTFSDRNSSEGSNNNLSLLNISASE